MSSIDAGGFGESAASLTFHDPDQDELGGLIDTQADEFRFNFTLPSQDFSAVSGTVILTIDLQYFDGKSLNCSGSLKVKH